MKNKFIAFLIVALALIIVAAVYMKSNHLNRQQDHLTLFGNVDIREVDLGFRVLGRLEALFAEEGDPVEPGQLIARLDKDPFNEELRQAEAKVKAAKSSLENAENIFARRQQLIGSEAVSQEEFDEASSSFRLAKANFDEADAGNSVADIRLKDTEIYAPSHGTVLTRVREPGAIVRVGDPVYTVSLTTPVQVRAYASERDLGFIYPGMAAEIYTDSTNIPMYKGRIGFISPVAEFTPKTVETMDLRTDLVYRLRIIVDNPDKYLRQGMPVTIKLNIQPQNP